MSNSIPINLKLTNFQDYAITFPEIFSTKAQEFQMNLNVISSTFPFLVNN